MPPESVRIRWDRFHQGNKLVVRAAVRGSPGYRPGLASGTQDAVDRILHVWVQVRGVDKEHLRAAGHQVGDRVAEGNKGVAKALAAMGRNQDQTPLLGCPGLPGHG